MLIKCADGEIALPVLGGTIVPLDLESVPTMALIYQTELTEVLFNEGSTDYVLVTFGNLGTRANGVDYLARSLAEKNDITCIGFAPRFPHWHPCTDIRGCIPAIADILKNRVVVTYGDSMGGYGALKHADLLGASLAIAGSPQFSIDPRDVPDDHRYRLYYDAALHGDNMRVQAPPPNSDYTQRYVLFDPLDGDDMYNVSLISAAVSVTQLRLPYTSHYSFRLLASSDAFQRFV